MKPWTDKIGTSNPSKESKWAKSYNLELNNKDTIGTINAVRDVVINLEGNKWDKSSIKDSIGDIVSLKYELAVAISKKGVNIEKTSIIRDPDSGVYDNLTKLIQRAPRAFRNVAKYIDNNWDGLKNYSDKEFRKKANIFVADEYMDKAFSDKQKLVRLFNNIADDIEKNKEKYQVTLWLATSMDLFKLGIGPSAEYGKTR